MIARRLLCACIVLAASVVHAEIFRWDSGEVIPGTEGIEPGPGMRLDGRNSETSNLRFADFSGGLNLTNSNFINSWLNNAKFQGANLTSVYFDGSALADADFTDAILDGVYLSNTTSSGFSKEQLYSTASYQQKHLLGVELAQNDLSGWNFEGQNLTGSILGGGKLDATNFRSANLENCLLSSFSYKNTNFEDAIVRGASFDDSTKWGFTKDKLYATASYKTRDLARINLQHNVLIDWDLSGQNLADASFEGSDLTNATLAGADLSRAVLLARLHGARFDGAIVAGANLSGVMDLGFTKAQLYSTASYTNKNLPGIDLSGNDLSGWEFSGQNLRNASFEFSLAKGANFGGSDLRGATLALVQLQDANLSGALVQGANFTDTTSRHFTKEQLYSTASYQQNDLSSTQFVANDLSGWDFSGQNLTGAAFHASALAGAQFTNAIVTGAGFDDTTSGGFTKEQLYSTASYQSKSLGAIRLTFNDLTGWDLSGQYISGAVLDYSNLTNANLCDVVANGVRFGGAPFTNADFSRAVLTNAELGGTDFSGADFSDAIISGAYLNSVTRYGFSKEQLSATASFKAKELTGVVLSNNDLEGWDFHGQDLTDARIELATLAKANFAGANLTRADLDYSIVALANFTNAEITHASLYFATAGGFSETQLYSTASYQRGDLVGVLLGANYLSGWRFHNQDLTGADFGHANLTNADFSNAILDHTSFSETTLFGADLRGAQLADVATAHTQNLIDANGRIDGILLGSNEALWIRDYDGDPERSLPPLAIEVAESMAVNSGGSLRLIFEPDEWDSLITFQPGIPVQLDGALELTFSSDVNVADQVGRILHIFDWTGVSPDGAFTIVSQYPWDVSELYTTGEVTLLLPGDTNGDQAVDLHDLNNVRNNFGGTGGGDTNQDGTVDLVDLNNVRNFFGLSAPQAVPEPSGLLLAAVAGASCIAVRRMWP